MKPVDLNAHQPHIVCNYKGDSHVLPLTLIRDIRNGSYEPSREIVKVMAQIVLDLADDKD